MLQESVHVNVGKQRTCNRALGRAASASLATTHAPCSIFIPLFDWCLQPQLDEPQHIPVDDASGHRFEEVRVRNRVEVFRQIGVNNVRVAPAHKPVYFLDGIDRVAARAISISAVLKIRLEDRLQHDLCGSLDDPVPDSWDTEWT